MNAINQTNSRMKNTNNSRAIRTCNRLKPLYTLKCPKQEKENNLDKKKLDEKTQEE
jgi:hypothetical protein